MTDITRGAEAVVAAGLVNTPQSVDVTYAHGGLTAVDGHPKEVYESIANGFYYPSSPEQRSLVIGSHRRARQVYWEIDSPADLDTKWPQALASKPDLIKIFLSNSEHYTSDSHRHPVLGDGLDPALVPLITVRAHAAGLKVAAHVDTAADYHFALVGGVDEMGHLPGYGIRASSNLVTFRISDADIALSALRHIKVQATAGIDVDANTPEPDLKARQDSQRENLTRLKAAGVPILIGSDHYGEDSLHEADYLHSLGIWSNGELLRMWSVETPQTIFPHRTIGELKPEYEASFLVLSANPLKDWAAIHRIVNRWKQGVRVEIN
jgi:imidazolonepropionase-like amidohydrolase